MDTIRVVWGTGHGPTGVAAYDAALADAGVHNYNLVHVSSVIPNSATVEAVGTAPDLGPAGNRLVVVEGEARAAGPTQVSAGLGWTIGDDAGLFYEAAGETDAETIEGRIRKGLEAGRALRDWSLDGTQVRTATVEATSGEYASATVLAVYGRSESII
ncbi:MAG: pyruvoyl-dependent arginine decarboxylase [Halodesulfurarchaeum sp.]